MTTDLRKNGGLRVAVIGAGFGGLAATIELKGAGYDDLVVFERSDEVGGVWNSNTYPGAACDVPAPYYSYSFAPNPRWPRRFSRQPAIRDYLIEVADRFDVRRHICFGTEIVEAAFDDSRGVWVLRTDAGDTEIVDILVSAVGQLSRPSVPAIPGRDTFQGESFHSAEWDHGVVLTGKRVAVVGTGASAIQFVPTIQPRVAALTVFQRTAPYLLPRPDQRFGRLQQELFARLPVTEQVERGTWWAVTEALAAAFLYSPRLAAAVAAVSKAHMRRQAGSKELFDKLWPTYPIGCKRVLFSSDYVPALARDNVTVVTDSIKEVVPEGLETADGATHEVDVIIYGTGFAATEFLAPMKVTGSNGVDLRERWVDGARAYLGMSIPGFPNLVLMYGPNTNIGSGSVVAMHEAQARYLRQYVDHVVATGKPWAVREEVESAYDQQIQARLADSVWTQCSSWYRNESGRVTANWPDLSVAYRRRTARFRPTDYEAVPAAPRTKGKKV